MEPERPPVGSWRPDPPTRDEIDAERRRVEGLREEQRELDALREREIELEVATLETDVRKPELDGMDLPEIASETAGKLHEALERLAICRRRCDAIARREAAEQAASPLKRLRALGSAREALHEWLDAPREQSPSRGVQVVRTVLLLACLAAVAAAFWLHLVFLVLLLPLAGASSFMLWSGQDWAWRRKGAERRYLGAGLAPPAEWNDAGVRVALARVDQGLREELGAVIDTRPLDPPSEEEVASAALDRVGAEERVASLARAARIPVDALDGPMAAWLDARGGAYRASRELARVRRELKSLRVRVEDARETAYRFLSRHGAAPAGASTAAGDLLAGLARLEDELAARGEGAGSHDEAR